MALFKPTKITGDVVIYSKWCVECDQPLRVSMIESWAEKKKLKVQIVRTAYRPADHEEAVKLWAKSNGLNLESKSAREIAEEYPTFIVYDKTIATLKEFVRMITNSKNKMVKGGSTKNDLSRLPEAEGASGASSLDAPAARSTQKNKKGAKGGKQK